MSMVLALQHSWLAPFNTWAVLLKFVSTFHNQDMTAQTSLSALCWPKQLGPHVHSWGMWHQALGQVFQVTDRRLAKLLGDMALHPLQRH